MKANKKIKQKLLRKQKLYLVKELKIIKVKIKDKFMKKKISSRIRNNFNEKSKTNTRVIPQKIFFPGIVHNNYLDNHFGTKSFKIRARKYYKINEAKKIIRKFLTKKEVITLKNKLTRILRNPEMINCLDYIFKKLLKVYNNKIKKDEEIEIKISEFQKEFNISDKEKALDIVEKVFLYLERVSILLENKETTDFGMSRVIVGRKVVIFPEEKIITIFFNKIEKIYIKGQIIISGPPIEITLDKLLFLQEDFDE